MSFLRASLFVAVISFPQFSDSKCDLEDLAALGKLLDREHVLPGDRAKYDGRTVGRDLNQLADFLLGKSENFEASLASSGSRGSALRRLERLGPKDPGELARLKISLSEYGLFVNEDAFIGSFRRKDREAAADTVDAAAKFLADYHIATNGNQVDSMFQINNVVVTTSAHLNRNVPFYRLSLRQGVRFDPETKTLYVAAKKDMDVDDIKDALSGGAHLKNGLQQVLYEYFNPMNGPFKKLGQMFRNKVRDIANTPNENTKKADAITAHVGADVPISHERGSKSVGDYLKSKSSGEIQEIFREWVRLNGDSSRQRAFEMDVGDKVERTISDSSTTIDSVNVQFGVGNVASRQVIMSDLTRWIQNEISPNSVASENNIIKTRNIQIGLGNVNNNTTVASQIQANHGPISKLFFLRNLRQAIANVENARDPAGSGDGG